MASEIVPYQDMEKMVADVIAAGIFPGFKSKAQVMSLFLLCQAEGMHPMKAVQLFDILPTGKVGIKSSALQAAFQARGGKIRWLVVSDTECEAEFMSAGLLEPIRVRWDMADARRAGLDAKPPWRQYPKAMLAARVTTDGINRADPGARFGGLYPTEVAKDIDDEEEGKRLAKALIGGAPKEEPGTALGTTAADMPEEPTEEELERPGIFAPDTPPEEARQAIKAAFGLETLADEAPPKAKRTPKLHDPEGPAPAVCPKCESEIGEFKSNSKAFPGRVYLQCRWAYGQKNRLREIGATNQEANGHVSEHYRAWKEAAK